MQQRKLITSSLARGITAAREKGSKGKGASLFLRDLDRKDDSCATAHDFLRMPPFSSISSACLSYFSPSSLIPVGGLTPLSLSVVLLFFFCSTEFNSCHRSANALSIFPDFYRHRVAFAYRFQCADTPESIRSPPFNITRLPASFLSVASGCIPACDSNRGWRTHCHINLFHLTVLPEVENYRPNTKTVIIKMGLKSIKSFFVSSWYYNNEIMIFLFNIL